MANTGILPGHWYYNTESGELTHGNNLENLGNNLLGGLGWHELNISGNATEAQAAAEARREFPNGKPPTTSLSTGAANAISNETGISTSGLAAIGDFFKNLGSAAWWLRIGEAALGLVLIAVGVARLVPAFTPAQMIARKVAAA